MSPSFGVLTPPEATRSRRPTSSVAIPTTMYVDESDGPHLARMNRAATGRGYAYAHDKSG
jgi:hypothetical protein